MTLKYDRYFKLHKFGTELMVNYKTKNIRYYNFFFIMFCSQNITKCFNCMWILVWRCYKILNVFVYFSNFIFVDRALYFFCFSNTNT